MVCAAAAAGGRCSASWNVEDVELAASGWFRRKFSGRVMRDVIAIDNVVIPVSLALLEGRALETECAFPSAGLGCVLGKRQLSIVIVPRAKQMDRLAVCRRTKGEVELNCGHFRSSGIVEMKDLENLCRVCFEQEELLLD